MSRNKKKSTKAVFGELKRFVAAKGRPPSINAENRKEVLLRRNVDNRMSQTANGFDPFFREAVLQEGWIREVSRKKSRPVRVQRREVVEFIKKNGRVPTRLSADTEERSLAGSLQNLTLPSGYHYNPNIAAEVKSLDKCFKTGVPVKFRPSINKALNGQPLREVKIEKKETT